MKRFISNPVVLIIGSFILLNLTSLLQLSINNSTKSNPKTANSVLIHLGNILCFFLGLIALAALITGIILAIKWLVSRSSRKE
jgi:hypothetical protein